MQLSFSTANCCMFIVLPAGDLTKVHFSSKASNDAISHDELRGPI